MPITSVSVRGHGAGLLACGDAPYNWEPARASTEFVRGWFSQRAEGVRIRWDEGKVQSRAFGRRACAEASTCGNRVSWHGAAKVTESFSANRLSKRATGSHQDKTNKQRGEKKMLVVN